MATYKVIQDIEAEDKLIGWLTPRQAIYAAIVIVSGLIAFIVASSAAWWLALPFLPHMILFSLLAGPFVHDQPSEVWLLAKIQFALKPRRRIWDQTGLKELVSITAPKKVERNLTDGLTQTEVKSRLQALANTIDSRGWAIKNVNVNMYSQPAYGMVSDDRLIPTSAFIPEVPTYDVTPNDDILDTFSNPTAQHLQTMITQSAEQHRQQVISQMRQAPTQAAPQQTWFSQNEHQAPSAADEAALLENAHKKAKQPKTMNSKLKVIDPKGADAKPKKKKTAEKSAEPVVAKPEPKIPSNPEVLQLAHNDDLDIATIARQANKANGNNDGGEVVISLR